MPKLFPLIKKIISGSGTAVINWALYDQGHLPQVQVAPRIDAFQVNATQPINISFVESIFAYVFDALGIAVSVIVDFAINFDAVNVSLAASISNLDISINGNSVAIGFGSHIFSVLLDAVAVAISATIDRFDFLTENPITISGSISNLDLTFAALNVGIAITNQMTFKYISTTTFTVPAGVTSLKVECWAGGGRGEGALVTGGGGGGGGAYSRKNALTVTPSATHTVHVGGNDDDSWFSTTGTVFAQRGQPGSAGSGTGQGAGGPGGSTASSIGDVKFAGGAGGGGGGLLANGGGGGGGAGDANTGGAGNSGGPAGAGGSANGGAGGIGGSLLNPGNPGSQAGGGGGGASTLAGPGTGAQGEVWVTFAA